MKLEREIDTVVVDVPVERPVFRRKLSVSLAPLTQEELSRRQADAIARAKEREAKHGKSSR